MARTKNRGQQLPRVPYNTLRRWRVGAYIRLSKEDLKKIKQGRDDSNSVVNQRALLMAFYEQYIEEFESIEFYIDDGHTGTDTDRDDFQRLLSDVMSGKINCVIVKDLSRFARNYSDAGSLIDNLFVQLNVRFISLGDDVDSYKRPDSVSDIKVPITNVINDNYCFQTSKKIRQVFDYKRRDGQYIGSFAPYGYVKAPEDKHKLVVDPEVAPVVKLIYSLLLKGTSMRAIGIYLNEHGIPSPSVYKQSKGFPVGKKGSGRTMWTSRMIYVILTSPVYAGDLVQGRHRVKSYKVHEIEAVPEEEWVVVPNTHEAIIDRETFDKVQSLLKRDTRTSPPGAGSPCVQWIPQMCGLWPGYDTKFKQKRERILRLFHLQEYVQKSLHDALYQAQPPGGRRPVCYPAAGASGRFLLRPRGPYQRGPGQEKSILPAE